MTNILVIDTSDNQTRKCHRDKSKHRHEYCFGIRHKPVINWNRCKSDTYIFSHKHHDKHSQAHKPYLLYIAESAIADKSLI